MVKGHLQLAQAYAAHVMDVYDHYRWRFTLKTTSLDDAFQGLDKTPRWQDKYFRPNSTAREEAKFWTGQLEPLPPAPKPDVPQSSFKAADGAAKPQAKSKRKAPVKKKAAKKKAVKKKAPARKAAERKTAKKRAAKKKVAGKRAPRKTRR